VQSLIIQVLIYFFYRLLWFDAATSYTQFYSSLLLRCAHTALRLFFCDFIHYSHTLLLLLLRLFSIIAHSANVAVAVVDDLRCSYFFRLCEISFHSDTRPIRFFLQHHWEILFNFFSMLLNVVSYETEEMLLLLLLLAMLFFWRDDVVK